MTFAEHTFADLAPSRSDERAAAAARTFTTLEVRQASSTAMRDPQQPGPVPGARDEFDEATLVAPGIGRTRAMVEPVNFPSMSSAQMRAERAARAAANAAATAAKDPAEVAREIIAEARQTARTMLAQAREVIASERTQAVQQGYDEGFAKGVADADSETAGLISTCEQIGVQVMEERQRALEDHEPDMVELAISVARRIVNAAIDVDETLVVEACRGAMRKAFQRGSLQVLAHPADLELLRTAGPELARELGGVEHLDFVEERRLERGSVVVRTPAGEIDGTIAGKAAKIEQALREGIEARQQAARRTAD